MSSPFVLPLPRYTAINMDPAKVPDAPAPWELKGEAWWFLISTAFNRLPAGELSSPGWFDPLHEGSRSLATEEGAFIGGDGMIQLLRYSESPVGLYDELLIIPGAFKTPSRVKPAQASRITRIYVSSMASVVNGRRNWNIPKSLAKFSFTPAADGSLDVKVFIPVSLENPDAPTFAETPFFAVKIKRSWFPSIPLNLKYLPVPSLLVQPPLEGSPTASEDGLIATDRWVSVDVSGYRGWVKTIKWEGGLTTTDPASGKTRKRVANGVDFPDVNPLATGLHFSDLVVAFPVEKTLSPQP